MDTYAAAEPCAPPTTAINKYRRHRIKMPSICLPRRKTLSVFLAGMGCGFYVVSVLFAVYGWWLRAMLAAVAGALLIIVALCIDTDYTGTYGGGC